ncbi:sigma-70 family RNA polymerase sigma factor [Fusobacterium sp.]|uniref:sigma-70 family RNA polymerase sigma factor n=1 Tax=Fusobacterium sp. TaxID=68766 RepID=UPI00290370F7|nr:sigma-70 family RNA polymerase sigma factor [Fusobacterium sp.]MDU1911748.1 sigma-70 family RNA polymerase sigma factor [Fusobacterium sp.]
MQILSVKELEKEIIGNYKDDDDFREFLDENSGKELKFDSHHTGSKEPEDINEFAEETVIDYLEELSNMEVISDYEEDNYLKDIRESDKEKIIVKNLNEVASIAFNYVKIGIGYMDIVQEGTVGLIKAIDYFDSDKNGDFKNYSKYWIAREIILYIENKVEDIRNEFKNFFRRKKDNFGKMHEHDHREEYHDEVHLKEEDLLPTLEAIEKKEKMVEKKIDFFTLENRLGEKQIEVLNYYFGFGKDKRYSIFEIEDILKLENGQGEELFQSALLILSTVEGKMFL